MNETAIALSFVAGIIVGMPFGAVVLTIANLIVMGRLWPHRDRSEG